MFIYFYAFCVFISEADLSEAGPLDKRSGRPPPVAFALTIHHQKICYNIDHPTHVDFSI
jgi:hypothetical protein